MCVFRQWWRRKDWVWTCLRSLAELWDFILWASGSRSLAVCICKLCSLQDFMPLWKTFRWELDGLLTVFEWLIIYSLIYRLSVFYIMLHVSQRIKMVLLVYGMSSVERTFLTSVLRNHIIYIYKFLPGVDTRALILQEIFYCVECCTYWEEFIFNYRNCYIDDGIRSYGLKWYTLIVVYTNWLFTTIQFAHTDIFNYG